MASPSLPEMTNWHKCSRLLIEGGLSILKEFLKNSHSPGSLDQFLSSKKRELTDLCNKHILNASQWAKLFPNSDIESLDITLLSCIISNCIIQPNSSQKTALDGIRLLRNKLFAHADHLSMDTIEFVKNWKLIDSALKKAQEEFGTNIPLQDFIDTVEKEEVVNRDEWREALETWKHNDDNILQEIQKTHKEISELKGEVKEHSSGISELKCEVKEHTSGISELKGEVKEHSSGISKLKGEVKEHSSEISELKGEVKEHSSGISELKGEVTEHSSGISELKGEVKEHTSGISELKGEVKEHSSGISKLKGEVKEHSSGISELKCEVKEHSSGMSEIKGEVKKHSSEISELKGEVNEMKATRRQIQSIRSKGSNDDSASRSIKKKRQQKVISSARVKRGSSDSESGSIKKKKSKQEVTIQAFDKQDLSELQIRLVECYTKYYTKCPVTATASSGCETDIDDIYAEPELKLVNHRALLLQCISGSTQTFVWVFFHQQTLLGIIIMTIINPCDVF